MFNLLKKMLFSMQPERAHEWALSGINIAYHTGTSGMLGARTIIAPSRTLMGLTFKNPVGLAAGFDKSAEYVDALAALGFGFVEVGTITPRPQTGNPKPRLFRLTEQQAIINRMGFNNKGIEHAMRCLEKTRYKGILGVNVGKNFDTPLEKATDDYVTGFRALWKFASYVTINISSPNTPGLRDLHQKELLVELLAAMKAEQLRIHIQEGKYVPLVVKISPDMSDEHTQDTANIILQQKIDGVIATNTTISREGVATAKHAKQQGGLSGAPLRARSTHVVKQLNQIIQNKIPIIAAGGIMDEQTAQEKMSAGASLLQLYTGFIYHGPNLIYRVAKAVD